VLLSCWGFVVISVSALRVLSLRARLLSAAEHPTILHGGYDMTHSRQSSHQYRLGGVVDVHVHLFKAV
jgi:hypothetical protein